MRSLVSILMSVYNGEEYLYQAIDSVLKQSYNQYEFLIINDASTDSTHEILKSYESFDSRIIVFNNNVRIGLTKSLNKLLQSAKGEYISIIDADDLWHKEKLSTQIDYLKNKPDLYLLGTSKVTIDKYGNSINGTEKNIYSYPAIKRNIFKGNLFCHSSIVFRRDVLDKIGFYNEEYTYCQDYELWLRVIAKYSAEILPEVLTYYRIHKNMISRAKRQLQAYYSIKVKFYAFWHLGHKLSISKLMSQIYIMLVPEFLISLKRLILVKLKKNPKFEIQ